MYRPSKGGVQQELLIVWPRTCKGVEYELGIDYENFALRFKISPIQNTDCSETERF